jgi:AraC-like DNA-binding protein
MWDALVARKLLRIQWGVPEGTELKATMAPVLCAGEVEVVSMALGPFDLSNTAEHSKEKEHRLSLHILTSGHSVTTERAAGESEIRKSMGTLLDEGAFYRQCSANELTRAFVLMLPKARLMEAAPRLADLLATPLDLSCQAFRLLQSYLNLFNAGVDFNDPMLAQLNADYVIDLVALMFQARQEARDAARLRGVPETRYAIIVSEIDRSLGDQRLNGAMVAARAGITERYLQQLMEAHGETFSHRLLRLRLEAAASMLTAQPTKRISEIAFACGFNDLSYFNRSFKKRFGESPRLFRK